MYLGDFMKIQLPQEDNRPEAPPEEPEFNLLQFLQNIDLDKYSVLDEEIAFPALNADNIIGTKEQIFQMFKNSVSTENDELIKTETRINLVNEKIEFYKSFLLDSEKRSSKIRENCFYIPQGFYLTELESERSAKNLELSASKNVFTNVNKKKTLENLLFSGYSERELTEFPGFLEAPQLLNSLSLKMDFKPSFYKYWSPIIRSEASCAILLDSFWWFYLKYFRKEPELEMDAYKYFCRISESYAALLISIHPSMRDRFFDNYASFLSQAIYLAFYKAFPDSRLQFNDNFKQEISNTVYEWVMGVRPVPENYLNWKINDEINITSNKDLKVTSNAEILQKIENLEKLLNDLGESDKEVKFADDLQKQRSTPHSAQLKHKTYWKSLTTVYETSNESHVMGEGAVIERFGFNLNGQSILINHYKKMYQLQQSKDKGLFVTRSEITKQPSRTEQTYRDFIYDSIERAKTNDKQQRKKLKEAEAELKTLEKERRKIEKDRLRRARSTSSEKTGRKSGATSSKRSSSLESSKTTRFDDDFEDD